MFIGKRKDGGKESHVTGWFFEIKRLFTVALLRFDPGTREDYHDHAFDCVSLIVGPGFLEEKFLGGDIRLHKAGKVLVTRRHHFHKVYSHGTTWVLTVSGPWRQTWHEQVGGKVITLTFGRKVVP
jgi:hypothetical protein